MSQPRRRIRLRPQKFLELRPIAELPGANRQDRTGGRGDHAGGDAAQERTSQTGTTVGAENKEIDSLPSGRPDDSIGGGAFDQQRGGPRSCLARRLKQSIQTFLREVASAALDPRPRVGRDITLAGQRNEG